jgi:hypothetical protein
VAVYWEERLAWRAEENKRLQLIGTWASSVIVGRFWKKFQDLRTDLFPKSLKTSMHL